MPLGWVRARVRWTLRCWSRVPLRGGWSGTWDGPPPAFGAPRQGFSTGWVRCLANPAGGAAEWEGGRVESFEGPS